MRRMTVVILKLAIVNIINTSIALKLRAALIFSCCGQYGTCMQQPTDNKRCCQCVPPNKGEPERTSEVAVEVTARRQTKKPVYHNNATTLP